MKTKNTDNKTFEKQLFVFKRGKTGKDNEQCDICGLLLKIGSITVKTLDGKVGHLNEIINHISHSNSVK